MDQGDWITIGLFAIGQVIAFLYWAAKQHNKLRSDMSEAVKELRKDMRDVEVSQSIKMETCAAEMRTELKGKASNENVVRIFQLIDELRNNLFEIVKDSKK